MTAADPNTGQVHEDLYQLSRPFPEEFIERKENADYVAHPIVNQRLLSIVGPFDFKLVEVIRGDVAAAEPNPQAKSRRGKAGTPALKDIVVGGIWRLVAEVDGRRVEVEEVGDVGDVHNWAHDGARLKDAASDALKRCAMRLGLGLHLWSKGHYFLDRQLAPGQAPVEEETAAEQTTAATQESEPGGASTLQTQAVDSTDADPAKAPDPSLGPVADGTPPGSDSPPRFGGPNAARAWLRSQPEEFRTAVGRTASEHGVDDLSKASLDDLNTLIEVAWKTHQAA